MSLTLRILLVVGAALIFVAMLWKIRKSEMKISDSLFWFLFSLMLIVLAVFPVITMWASGLLGIESPANLVFLFVIAVLLVREFASTAEISTLRNKVTTLVQAQALESARIESEDDQLDL